MFSFTVNKNEIIMTESETITSGSVNAYECKFEFSEDWAGLSKTVTFRAGYVKISVILDSTNTCSIPWEVLEKDATQLYCGVRGTVTALDEEEDAIIPTIYCLLGTIRKGTELGDNAAPPEPSVVDQIMSRIDALDSDKQNKLTGKAGQVVGFDGNGNAIAQDNESPVYEAGDNISISGGVISAKNSTYSIVKDEAPGTPGAIAEYHLVDNTKADDVVIVGDSIAIPDMRYDDTEIRSDIGSVSALTDEVAATAAANTTAISAINDSVAGINTKLDSKQNKLTAGNNIRISGDVISAAMYDDTGIKSDIAKLGTDKQDKLTAGDNINIENNVISANAYDDTAVLASIAKLGTDKQDKLHGETGQVVGFDADGNAVAQSGASPVYTAGDHVHISENNVISADMYDDTSIKSDISKLGTNKQDKLTAGDHVHISGNTISADMYDDTSIKSDISKLGTNKQDKLTAGDHVHISENNTISADMYDDTAIKSDISKLNTGKQDKLTAGDHVHISENNTISADMYDDTAIKSDISKLNTGKQDKLTAGDHVHISENNTISADMYDDTAIKSDISKLGTNKQDKLTAGDHVHISENNTISADMYDDTAIKSDISKLNTGKQDKLTAGDHVHISGNTISADMYDDTSIKSDISKLGTNKQDKLTAGDHVHISENNTISADMYDDTAIKSDISKLNTGKQNKLSGTAGQVVGFDADGNAVAQDGGADGVTFTPNVSSSGVISWTNDGGRENPAAVDITGPAGAAAGFGTVTATVTNTTGTPSVTVTTSGSNTAKNFDFAFSGLKGESADPSSVPEYSIAQAAAADYPKYDSVYMMKKDGVALTPHIYIPRHGKYVGNLTSEFTHLDIASGSQAFDAAKFSTDWGLDIYYGKDSSNKALIYDFYLYPKTDSTWTLDLSSYKSGTEIDSSGLEYKVYNTGISSMRSNNHMGKIFLLQAAASSFKVKTWGSSGVINTTSTDRIYLYCEVSLESNMLQEYLVFTFKSLMPNPADRSCLGPNASCRLVQLS